MMDTNAPRSTTLDAVISQTTGKRIGCVQHDCDNCQTLAATLAEAVSEAEAMAKAEILGGNIVKKNWWRGKLAGLRAAQSMLATSAVYSWTANVLQQWWAESQWISNSEIVYHPNGEWRDVPVEIEEVPK